MILSSVLLPHPLGPIRLTNSPAFAYRSTAWSTANGCPRWSMYLLTPSSWTFVSRRTSSGAVEATRVTEDLSAWLAQVLPVDYRTHSVAKYLRILVLSTAATGHGGGPPRRALGGRQRTLPFGMPIRVAFCDLLTYYGRQLWRPCSS